MSWGEPVSTMLAITILKSEKMWVFINTQCKLWNHFAISQNPNKGKPGKSYL